MRVSRQISTAELSAANTPEKGYVAIRGEVYDLTKFMERHPGGWDIILAAVGRDCTIVFETSHDSKAARILEKYHVGSLSYSKDELPHFPPPSAFGLEMNRRMKEFFVSTNQDPKHAPWLLVRYATIALIAFTTYYLQFFSSPSSLIYSQPWLLYLVSAVFGLSLGQVACYFVHDGSHGSFGHNPTVWNYMALLHDFLNGCSSLNWFYQHVLGHHVYTNIDGADPDIAVNEIDIRRIRPWQRHLEWYGRQYVYMPILYCFLMMKTRLMDFNLVYLKKSNVNIRMNPLVASQHATFWGGKIFFLTYRLVLPLLFSPLPFKATLFLFFLSDFVQSWALALIFQANHVVSEVEWPQPNEQGMMEEDWAKMQVETAQDYAHGSWATAVLTGGLNYQVVHHLFPHHSQYYYPQMAPIVRQVCKEYGIKYIVRENLWEAIGGHIGLLHFLASGEAAFGHQMDDHVGSDGLTERERAARDAQNLEFELKTMAQLGMVSGKVNSISNGWGIYGLVAMVCLWRWRTNEKLEKTA